MGAVIVIAGVILMVVIHEGAHFLAAKAFNIKATEAFFGFGPRLWSMKKGETEYGIKALPLGGYVRIIGMNPFEEVDPADEGRTYRENPFWKKSVVVLAGIGSHFVVAAILMYAIALAYGVADSTTEIDRVSTVIIREIEVENPISLDLESGDTIVAIDGLDIDLWTGSDKLPGAVTAVTVDRDGRKITLETTDRVEPTPALLSGVEVGDRLVEMDGVPINTWDEFVGIAEARPDVALTVIVDRDGALVSLPTVLTSRENAAGKTVGFFGVSSMIVWEDVGPITAVGEAASDMWTAIRGSVAGLIGVVANFGDLLGAAVGDGEVPIDRPISPIGLARISGPVEIGLNLLAFVNVFVGVLNFVPLYPLDGGHFSVALYEKVRGRPADVRKLMPLAVAVFIFVVMLGLLGIYFDIVDPIQLPE
jgi:RIP metalloprotease RseP